MIVLKASPLIRLGNSAEDVLQKCGVLPPKLYSQNYVRGGKKIASKHMMVNLKPVEILKQRLWPKPRKSRSCSADLLSSHATTVRTIQ